MMPLLLLFGIGLTTGTLSGLFGVGGGFILIPLLTLTGVSIKSAVALSLTYIIGTGLAGVFRHFKQQTLDLVLALALSLSAIITAQLGVQLTLGLPGSTLKLYFGLLTVSVAIFYIFRRVPKEKESNPESSDKGENNFSKGFWRKTIVVRHKEVAGRQYYYSVNLPLALVIGAVVGLISGMFGVGGGFLLVPLMVTVLKIPMKIAVGTSLLSVIAPAISGSLSLWFAGKLDLSLLPVLLLGGLIGVQVGVKFLLLIKEQSLKIAFTSLLITVSAYMLALGFQLI